MNASRLPEVVDTHFKRDQGFMDHGGQRLSRSPHPYHRSGSGPHTSGGREDNANLLRMTATQSDERHLHSPSDSGTEADDERGTFLKGLPAPPLRPRKGLRGGTPVDKSPILSPLPSPPATVFETRRLAIFQSEKGCLTFGGSSQETEVNREKYMRCKRAEIVRRTSETSLLILAGFLACSGADAAQRVQVWRREIVGQFLVVLVLYVVLPLKRSYQAYRSGRTLKESIRHGLHIKLGFEPGPFLYPVFLPPLVSVSLLCQSRSFILPNLILGLSALPSTVIPLRMETQIYSLVHWGLTVIPLVVCQSSGNTLHPTKPLALHLDRRLNLDAEVLILLYPLHVFALSIVHHLTTTSLDPAESQLLSSALTNIFLFSTSPQSEILKALLCLGGIFTFILCHKALAWEVALARIPAWRFQHSNRQIGSRKSFFKRLDEFLSTRLVAIGTYKWASPASDSEDEFTIGTRNSRGIQRRGLRMDPPRTVARRSSSPKNTPTSAIELRLNKKSEARDGVGDFELSPRPERRHTFSTIEPPDLARLKTTKGGRPRRSMDSKSSSFLSFTPVQARARTWLYAAYVYAAVIFIILIPVRRYVSVKALSNHEPFGWALGYLLGDLSLFRFWTIATNLDRWIALPPRVGETYRTIHLGWVEHVRQDTLGQANTRLLLCAYYTVVLVTGITVVLRFLTAVEVDTRRKVFHGLMVAMFLPTIFVDPCFAALAFVLILAIFILLDLFRASQLPPISKPLTYFLAPYVDGRDHRGPVIVSHIFLLIGCAIPLWLSLAGAPRSGVGPWSGWDTPVRNISMVSGIVCVGLGDAAASLIGRRFGRHKWIWPGGKSLEGSIAFAGAVTAGLMFAFAWLRLGGWIQVGEENWRMAVAKATVAALGASLLESVLTGANDNVIVPVVLWLLVRGLGL